MNRLTGCFKLGVFIVSLVLITGSLRAQLDTITLAIQDQLACVGDTAMVSITVNNFSNVEGVQLNVAWNPAALSFLTTCNEAISSLSIVESTPGTATVFWTDLSGQTSVDLANGDTLLTFKFNVLDLSGNNLDLSFVPTNELAFFDGIQSVTYPLNLINGSISLNDIIHLETTSTPISCLDTVSIMTASSVVDMTTFAWYGPDDFTQDTAIIAVNNFGNYTVIAQNGNCIDSMTISIPYDTLSPDIIGLTSDTITCLQPQTIIMGEVIPEPDLLYSWILPMGNELMTDSTFLEVNSGGMYQWKISNSRNGCVSIDTINVVADTALPQGALQDTLLTLSCGTNEQTLFVSSAEDSIRFIWKNEAGEELSTTDSLIVNSPGDYAVLILDEGNGCTSELSATINGDYTLPDVSILGDSTLTCDAPSQLLTAVSNSQDEVHFIWTDSEFTILNMEDTISVTTASERILIAENVINSCKDTLSFGITWDTIAIYPQITPLTDTITCLNEQANFEVIEDTSNLALQWLSTSFEPLETGNVFETQTAGLFYLSALNIRNGCTSIQSIEVETDTLSPNISIPHFDTLNCITESLQLNIESNTPGTICEWTGIADTCSIEVNSAGTYVVTIINLENGCSSKDSIAIEDIRNELSTQLQTSGTINCMDSSVLIEILNPLPQVGYEWFNQIGTNISVEEQITVSEPGVYTVISLDTTSQCTGMDSIVILSDTALPQVSLSAPDTLSCRTSLSELNIDTPDPEYNIQWSDSEGNVLDNNLVNQEGTYYAMITNTENHCTVVDSVIVESNFSLPEYNWTFNNNPPIITCEQPEVIATASATNNSPVDFIWKNLNTNIISETDSYTFVEAAEIMLIAINISSGCETDTLIAVTENKEQPVIEFNEPDLFDCLTAESFISSIYNAHYLYQWTTTDETNIESPSQNETYVFSPGIYQLIVIDTTNGCINTDSIELDAASNGIQSASIQIHQPECDTEIPLGAINIGSIQGGIGPYHYILNTNDTTSQPLFPDLHIGDYPLTIIDQNGCQWDTLLTISEPNPIEIALLVDNQSMVLGDSIHLAFSTNVDNNSLNLIQWHTSEGVLLCDNCPLDTIIRPFETTSYNLYITSVQGCSASTKVTIFVQQNIPIFIPNAFSPNDDGINDHLSVYTHPSVTKINNFQVFDRWGNQVFYQDDLIMNDPNAGWDGTHQNTQVNAGVYVYTLEAELIDGSTRQLSGEVVLLK